MGDEKMVSAEEARGLLHSYGVCEIRRYVAEHDDECRLEYIGDAGKWTLADDVPDGFDDLLVAAPDLAHTVIALHARAEQAEQALAREKQNAAARELLLTRRTDALRAAEREVDELKAERDRLARILAVERGDESQAPEGWRRMEHVSGWRRRDRHGRGWTVRYERLGDDWHTACVYLDGIRVGGEHPTALEAMEAADAAREGSDA